MSISIMTNTYPFAVVTNSKYSAFWVIDQRTGECVSKKNLSEKQAEEVAREKHLEMTKIEDYNKLHVSITNGQCPLCKTESLNFSDELYHCLNLNCPLRSIELCYTKKED